MLYIKLISNPITSPNEIVVKHTTDAFFKSKPNNESYVVPYGDNPLDEEVVGEDIYLNIINQAKKKTTQTNKNITNKNKLIFFIKIR